jgi:stage V sporulation protein S
VDRFFSKLDLRDIKIDPFKTSFPPDADDDQQAESTPAPTGIESSHRDEPGYGASSAPDAPVAFSPDADDRQPHTPAWVPAAPEPAPVRPNGHAQTMTAVETVVDADYADDVEPAPAPARDGQSGEVLKVSARSRPSAVAGAIAGVVREAGRAEVQAIGAGATNQAVKAVAIARDYLRETGIEAVCLPAFIDVTIDNEDRTAIRLVVEPR